LSGGGITLTAPNGENWGLATATVFGSPGDAGGVVCSNGVCAAPANNTGGSFSGYTFSGGFFATATITFSGTTAANTNNATGWPAWWELPIEKANNKPFGGLGAGYLEDDMMEYMPQSSSNILSSLHDWHPSGEQSNDCCHYTGVVPPNTAAAVTHTYAQLWTPGLGVINWIDGVQVGSQGWVDFACTAQPATVAQGAQISASNSKLGTAANQTYANGDCEHPFFIFGGQQGLPFTITNFQVWQHA
jgi:hypothetical protein